MAATGSIEKRFWAKVDKSGDCWEFTGYKCRQGYGRIYFRGNSHWLTHRVSWILHGGKIPNGMNVLHRCDNPSCVRPSHLFLGTHQDNMRDMNEKGRGKVPCLTGEQHGMAKLTTSEVLLMRELLAFGCKQKAISRLFQISITAVSQIKNRHRWAHI